MSRLLLLAALLGLGLGLATPDADAAPTRPGAIVGVVLDSAGNAVPGAVVALRNADGLVDRLRADRAGRFTFPKVRPGRYVVLARKRGVGKDRQRVGVRSGDTVRVRLVLQ